MAEIFKVEIITPDRIFYEGEAEFMEFTTAAGDIGVYAKHIPMTTVLAPGAVVIHNGEEETVAAVHSGFAEILGDKVTLLAEIADLNGKRIQREWVSKEDLKRAFSLSEYYCKAILDKYDIPFQTTGTGTKRYSYSQFEKAYQNAIV